MVDVSALVDPLLPAQASELLARYGRDVTAFLPLPSPQARAAVEGAFFACGWSVGQRKPLPGAAPPSGEALFRCLVDLGRFFGARTSAGAPPAAVIAAKLARIRGKELNSP